MTLFESLNTCFDKYASICGRATRSEFWWFNIFAWAILLLIIVVGWCWFPVSTTMLVACFWLLISIIPMMSVAVRRLHDIGKSGWWLLRLIAFYVLVTGVGAGWTICCGGTAALSGNVPLWIGLGAFTVAVLAYNYYIMSRPSIFPHSDDGEASTAH